MIDISNLVFILTATLLIAYIAWRGGSGPLKIGIAILFTFTFSLFIGAGVSQKLGLPPLFYGPIGLLAAITFLWALYRNSD